MKSKTRKLTSLLLALLLTLGLFAGMPLTARAATVYTIQDSGDGFTSFSWAQWIANPPTLADGDTVAIGATTSPGSIVTLNFPGNGYVSGISSRSYQYLRIACGGDLTIEDLTLNASSGNPVTLSGVNSTLTVKDACSLTGAGSWAVLHDTPGGTLTINGAAGSSLEATGYTGGINTYGSLSVGTDLTVKVTGNAFNNYGVRLGGDDATISGTGSLTVSTADTATNGTGIFFPKNLTVSGLSVLSVSGKGTGAGLYSSSAMGASVVTFNLAADCTISGGKAGIWFQHTPTMTIVNNGAGIVTFSNDGSSGPGIYRENNGLAASLTISGTGQMNALGSGSGEGINVENGTLTISGPTVTAAGGASGRAVSVLPSGSITFGTGALSLQNNSGADETHTFAKASGSEVWSVAGTGVTHTGNVSDASISVTVPTGATGTVTRITASPTVLPKAVTIGTTAPVTGSAIANGTNTKTNTTGPIISWSNDNGVSWTFSDNFAASTTYKSKYVYTANSGYKFDPTLASSDITVTNIGSGSVSAAVSTATLADDTLTVTVTWPATVAGPGSNIVINSAADWASHSINHPSYLNQRILELRDGNSLTINNGASPQFFTTIQIDTGASVAISGSGAAVSDVTIVTANGSTTTIALNNVNFTHPTANSGCITLRGDDTVSLTGNNVLSAGPSASGVFAVSNAHTAIINGSGSLVTTGTANNAIGIQAVGGTIKILGNATVTANGIGSGNGITTKTVEVASGLTLIANGGSTSGAGISGGGDLTIVNNGTIQVGGGAYGLNSQAGSNGLTYSGSGVLTATGGSNGGIMCNALTMNGGTINANGSAAGSSGLYYSTSSMAITVNSGTLNVTGTGSSKAITRGVSSPNILVGDGGVISLTNKSAAAEINTFEKSGGTKDWSLAGTTPSGTSSANTLSISVAAGATGTIERTDTTPTGVCSIDGVGYPTLTAALASINDGETKTIRLLQTINYPINIAVENNKSITFDMNGFNLNVNTTSMAYSTPALRVDSGCKVLMTGTGDFNVSGGQYGVQVYGNGEATVTNATSSSSGKDNLWKYDRAVSITGGYGKVTVLGNATGHYYGVYAANTDSTVFVGGNVTATKPATSDMNEKINGHAVYADVEAKVTVQGSVTAVADGCAVYAGYNSVVTVGSAIVQGSTVANHPGIKNNGSQITILGNCTVNGNRPVAVYCAPYSAAGDKGEVTINGALTTDATQYIRIADNWTTSSIDDGDYKNIGSAEYAAQTTKDGFYTYTYKTYGNVWIRNSATPATVTGVTVTPATATVQKGATHQFNATVQGTNSPMQSVTWSVNSSTGSSISVSGLLSVAAGETSVTLTVTATSVADNTKSGTATVTVSAAPPPSPTVTSVTVTPGTVTLGRGAAHSFSAVVNGTNSPGQGVTWSVNSTAGSTISAAGLLSVAAGETSATLTVRATSTVDSTKSGTATVTVTQPGGVYTITFDPNGGTVNPTTMQTGADARLPLLPNPSRASFTFLGWYTLSTGGTVISSSYVFSDNTTVYAHWQYIQPGGSSGSNGDGGGGSGSVAVVQPVTNGTVTVYGVSVPYTMYQPAGAMSITLTASLLDRILAAAGSANPIVINMGGPASMSAISIVFPPSWFAAHPNTAFSIQTAIGGFTLDNNVAKNFPSNKTTGRISLYKGSIVLEAEQDDKVVSWNNPAEPLKLYMAYEPTEDTDTNAIVLFDKATGKIITHSFYADGKVFGLIGGPGEYDAKIVSAGFTDTANHWANNSITFVAARGLMRGSDGSVFSPNAPMTRAMFATVLARLDGVNLGGYRSSAFGDVDISAWYGPAVAWAADIGIVSGVGEGKFNPDASITREQMAVMLYNYIQLKNYTLPKGTVTEFADSAMISPWAKDAAKAIQQVGIINGKPGNLFDPQGIATRAEVAAIFDKFLKLGL